MSHASMLKARRQHQKTRKLLEGEIKLAKRQAKVALAGPVLDQQAEIEADIALSSSEMARARAGMFIHVLNT